MMRSIARSALAAVTATTSLAALVSCVSLQGNGRHVASTSASPKKVVRTLRDPAIRSEIRAEIADLKALEDEKNKLRAEFASEPLKGPLTLAKLEQVLVAEYRANALQKRYLAESQHSDAPAGSEKTSALQPGSAPKAEAEAAATTRPRVQNTLPDTNPNKSHKASAIRVHPARASLEPGNGLVEYQEPITALKKLRALENSEFEFSSSTETPFIFDIPVTYNSRVRQWIQYFQTTGRDSFRIWLERSSRYLPLIQYELTRAGLPQDLVYVAMIESGFSPNAVSHAGAMGMWQFIVPTARRYGMRIDWWIDERKDFHKSTLAAIGYMTDLYRQFNSWYLVAASYNMGENGVRRLIHKHNTNNFWELADKGVLPNETRNYVPKIIAAMLISKAPALYGFRDLDYQMPMSFEFSSVPGGTDLINLASYLGVSEKYLKVLNPELIKGFVPRHVGGHKIRIPKGSMMTVSQYVRLQGGASGGVSGGISGEVSGSNTAAN